MNTLSLGLVAESLQLPLRTAMQETAKFGVQAVQFSVGTELAPKTMGQTARREFRTLLRSYNLSLAALSVPLRHGLDAFENQQPRLERIMEAMHFAADLGTRCVVVPMPKLPAMGEQPAEVPAGVFLFNKPPDRGETLRTSLTELGRLADRIGVRLALEVGQDSGAGVAAYLTQYDVGSLGVVLDPANFLMNRHDPHAAVMALHERLWLVHARDARLSGSTGPVEVPVGAGDLEWMSWIAGLAAVDYRGAVCVKQTVGENRKATLGTSIAFLRRFLPEAQM